MSQATKTEGWRAPILKHFTRDIAKATRLTIVADPDQLLTEEHVLDALRTRGFELIPFDDHIAFRFAYESRYRKFWDEGRETNLVVVLRTPMGATDSLPFDLLELAQSQGRCFSISIGEIFPRLAPMAIGELDPADYDDLYRAEVEREGPPLGVNPSRDFVLHHVFGVVPDLVRKPPELLRVLLRRHYSRRRLPAALDLHLIGKLRATGCWDEWPLEDIVPSRSAFLSFLQERWPIFLKGQVDGCSDSVAEDAPAYGLQFSGPDKLPFGHDDVWGYIDRLFQESALVPTDAVAASELPREWMRVGVLVDEGGDRAERFARLHTRLESSLPEPDATHRDWVDYSYAWAEWLALRWADSGDALPISSDECDVAHDRTELRFQEWMLSHFGSLHNLSPAKRPAMVHHIAHHMAHGAGLGSQQAKRLALVVVDGLALDQWVLVRAALIDQMGSSVQIDEDAAFAWVPTLTSVSRQAIFAGEAPIFFEASLGSTHKEPAHWKRFWENRGVLASDVGYIRQNSQEPDAAFLERVKGVSQRPSTKYLGVVVGTVDQTMHGIVTGSSGLHGVVRDWADRGCFTNLVRALIADEYEVLVTSDHGNITGHGMGKPKVGAIADERGERAHVFPDDLTREDVRRDFEGTIAWPQTGIPEGYRPLLAPGRSAFLRSNTTAVGHGGIAMEEVIVPFVRITGGRE